MNKSIFNLNQNLAAALSYVFGPVSGLFFYIAELITGNNNKFVRFHALQSTIFFGGISIIQWILGLIRWFPFVKTLIWGINTVSFLALILLIFMAYKGKNYRLPVIGDVCWEQINK